MIPVPARNQRGFTLVELIIVIGIFGIIMGAVYTLYLTHQRNAYSQEELIDVQQNLRIAMDMITRDLRMAGALVPGGTPPVEPAPFNNHTTAIRINTASAAGRYARIVESKTTNGSSSLSIAVDSAESVDSLLATDLAAVRLVRPLTMSNPLEGMGPYLALDRKNSNRDTATLVMTSPDNGPLPVGITLTAGDIIAAAGPAPPNDRFDTITYSLGPCDGSSGMNCLLRRVNNGAPETIASSIAALRFSNLYTKGTEGNPAEEDTIRAVRVTITAASAATAVGGEKSRRMTSIVTIRNRR